MANYFYVKSGGTASGGSVDAADGVYSTQKTGTWASAFSAASEYFGTLEAAVEGTVKPTGGDFVLFSDQHAASYASGGAAINIVGASFDGIIIASVDDANDITAYLPGASDTNTSTTGYYNTTGFVTINGVDLSTEDDVIRPGSQGSMIYLRDTTLTVGAGSSDTAFKIIVDGVSVQMDGGTIDFNSTLNSLAQLNNGGKLTLKGVVFTGSALSNMFIAGMGANGGAQVQIEGCDLSTITGTLMPSLSIVTCDIVKCVYKNCRLNASVTLHGTLNTPMHRFEMYGCDDSTGNALHRFYIADGAGTAKNSDSVYVTATDSWYGGTDKSSIQVDTTSQCNRVKPFIFELPQQYVDLAATGSDVVTLEMVTTEVLNKQDICAFMVYPDGTTAVIPNTVSSGPSATGFYGCDPLDDSTAMPAGDLGAADWTGEPAGSPTPNFYKLELDTTGDPGQQAAVSVRIEVYKDLTAPVYIHPLFQLS